MEHTEWPHISLVITPHSMMRAKKAAWGRKEHVLVAEEFKIVYPEPAVPEGSTAPLLLGDEHASVLHTCCDAPTQGAPLPEGAGLLQERVCVPPPHDTEQAVQLDQTPSTVRVQLMLVLAAG